MAEDDTKLEPATVIGVAASPAVPEDGVTEVTVGTGLLLPVGGGVVVLEPPPPPQPAIANTAHNITAGKAHVERGMGRPGPMSW